MYIEHMQTIDETFFNVNIEHIDDMYLEIPTQLRLGLWDL